jgi:hypothetical protein
MQPVVGPPGSTTTITTTTTTVTTVTKIEQPPAPEASAAPAAPAEEAKDAELSHTTKIDDAAPTKVSEDGLFEEPAAPEQAEVREPDAPSASPTAS